MRLGQNLIQATLAVLCLAVGGSGFQTPNQQPATTVQKAPGPNPTPAPVFQMPASYPTRQVDPAKVDRGKVIFGVNCAFCHGNDARGGEGGPNLIRSQLVLNDKDGESISATILNGRTDRGMPKFDFTAAQISDIAAYIHSFKVGGYDASREKPPSILVGDATAGEAAFNRMCASCHSVKGDLKGFGSSIPDPRTLQQTWIMPGMRSLFVPAQGGVHTHVPPTTVTVTFSSGETVQGELKRIDDFFLTLKDSQGDERTIHRENNEPKIVIHDALEPHRKLLAVYTDKEIHDITSYLESIK